MSYIKHMVDTCTDAEGRVDMTALVLRYSTHTGKTFLPEKEIYDYIKRNKLTAQFISEMSVNTDMDIWGKQLLKK